MKKPTVIKFLKRKKVPRRKVLPEKKMRIWEGYAIKETLPFDTHPDDEVPNFYFFSYECPSFLEDKKIANPKNKYEIIKVKILELRKND